MLLGGYFMLRLKPVGVYMAWWTGLYALGDGTLQLYFNAHYGRTNSLAWLHLLVALMQMRTGAVIPD